MTQTTYNIAAIHRMKWNYLNDKRPTLSMWLAVPVHLETSLEAQFTGKGIQVLSNPRNQKLW